MKTALIRYKVLILSILESRDLVNTGVLAAAAWYLMGGRVPISSALVSIPGEKTTQELPDDAWSTAYKRRAYRYIGQVGNLRADLEKSEIRDEEGNQKAKIRYFLESEWFSGWRWELVSTIRLASLVPLVALNPLADRFVHYAAAGTTIRIGDVSV